MRKIAKLSSDEMAELITNTSSRMGLKKAIIEKDFWVCWTLDYLFHKCRWKEHLAFKGGTSLSKAYGLIQRFSEDIDLILDWRVLGYESKDPWIKRSKTKQDAFNKEANEKTIEFLKTQLLPVMKQELYEELEADIDLQIDSQDKQTLIFSYPQRYADNAILQIIRLEIEALAAWTPTIDKAIQPYVAEFYPKLFSKPSTEILTVSPERTFWEKVTILHKEAHRSAEKNFPERYSRHYYDFYCMMNSEYKEKAFKEIELLEKVVEFKKRFYSCSWARYEDAKPGTMKLMPPVHNVIKLQEDYAHMGDMIFGKKPIFDQLLSENISDRKRNQCFVTEKKGKLHDYGRDMKNRLLLF